jgi:hypothetical protein
MFLPWSSCQPPAPPAGAPVAVTVQLTDQHLQDHGYQATLRQGGAKVQAPLTKDSCRVQRTGGCGGVGGGSVPVPAMPEVWLSVQGEPAPILLPPVRAERLAIEPYGRWIEVGWAGGGSHDLHVPPGLEITAPELDGTDLLDPDAPLDLRWTSTSSDYLELELVGPMHSVECRLVDDGEASIPAWQVKTLHGEVRVRAQRVVREYGELPDGRLLALEVRHWQRGTLQFED